MHIKLLDCASEITRAVVTVVHGLPSTGTILRMSRALSAAKQLFFSMLRSLIHWCDIHQDEECCLLALLHSRARYASSASKRIAL